MKFINILKSPFSLGWMGLVMLAMAGLLFASVYFLNHTPVFDTSMERMEQLAKLEDDVAFQLGEMQLNEAYAIYSLTYGYGQDEESIQAVAQADAEITTLLGELTGTGTFEEDDFRGESIQQYLDEFNELRNTHRATFQAVLASYDALEKDDSQQNQDATSDLLEQLQLENETLNYTFSTLTTEVKWSMDDWQSWFPDEANQVIWVTAGGLTLTLLLGLLGYQRLSAISQPIGTLTNAIMAIGGGQYRDSLLGELIKHGGPAGDCARSLQALAKGVEERNAGLVAENERVRQALYESRRRRLKISRPVEERSEAR